MYFKYMKKQYQVSLDEKIVEEAKTKMEYQGGKLSSLLNNLLKGWVHYKKESEELVIKALRKEKAKGS